VVFDGVLFDVTDQKRAEESLRLAQAAGQYGMISVTTMVRAFDLCQYGRLEEAARTMGVAPARVFWRVTLPVAAPGILASWVLVFITAMKELPTAILLRPPGFDTLPVRIWAAASESVHTQAAPPAFLLILLTTLLLLAPAAALTRLPLIFYPLRLPGLGKMLASLLLRPWIIPLALRLIYQRRERLTARVAEGYAAPFREPNRRLALAALCRQVRIPPLAEIEAMLAQLRQPMTFIWGKKDRILPVRQAHWLQERLPQAEFHFLRQVGHAPQEEAPEEVNEIIIDFLSRTINN
jgi:homoserine acetyltransferase